MFTLYKCTLHTLGLFIGPSTVTRVRRDAWVLQDNKHYLHRSKCCLLNQLVLHLSLSSLPPCQGSPTRKSMLSIVLEVVLEYVTNYTVCLPHGWDVN